MSTLPEALTVEQFRVIRRDESRLRPGVDALCAKLGAGGRPITRFADGSLPVYAVGDELVLKLYPPAFPREREVEACVLVALQGKLPIPTPRVHAAGEHDGWGFVLMDRLVGESLATAWPRIPPADREHLAAALGEGMAALHAVADPALEIVGPPDWAAFEQEQRVTATARQRAKGLDPRWLDQIDAYLASVALAPGARRALLHTEIMREHLLVQHRPEGFRLSGLFDFEPAMRGAPEYELASIGVFVSCGDARFLRTLLRAYGYRDAELDRELSRRLLAFALLHRYSHLGWYLERLPPPPVPTLAALALTGWGVEVSSFDPHPLDHGLDLPRSARSTS
jgi:hygromycin-B 7''-O-kinase